VLVQRSQAIDEARAREVIFAYPWALLVTSGEEGLIASHMPAVLDEMAAPGELVALSHTARADPQTARIESGEELLLVFQGEHGFLPGAWSGGDGASTGTWGFEAVHAYGRPQLLDREGSLDLLRRTFEHLEARRSRPTPWSAIEETAREIVGGTCCFRLPVERVAAKAKLGQGKDPEVVERLIMGLEQPGPYQQRGLAARMREALG